MRGWRLWPLACAWLVSINVVAKPLDIPSVDSPEHQLMDAVTAVQDGRVGEASRTLRQLVKRQPNFRLAQLLYGDVLAMRSGAKGLSPLEGDDPELKALMSQFRVRLADVRSPPPPGAVPSNILKLAPNTNYAIVVNLVRSRLYVIDNRDGHMKVVRSYYASIAKDGYGKKASGDLRTPVGIYRITGFKPGKSLPAEYGAGAFPINYPNLWDRDHGRTGYGIWLHGVPRASYVRPPRTSEGCVVLANDDLLALKPVLDLRGDTTPIVLSDNLSWVKPEKQKKLRTTLERDIQNWRESWSKKDTTRYLSYYAPDFHTGDGMTRSQFATYKRRINAAKRYIHVKVRDLSLYQYPGTSHLVLAQFVQDYESNNYHQVSRKQQYWRQQPDGQWKIVLEASY